MHSYSVYSKVVLKHLACNRFISRLIRWVISIIKTKAKVFGIILLLVYDHIKRFCDLKLNYNLMVCGMPKLIKLCYYLAYKEHFSICIVLQTKAVCGSKKGHCQVK